MTASRVKRAVPKRAARDATQPGEINPVERHMMDAVHGVRRFFEKAPISGATLAAGAGLAAASAFGVGEVAVAAGFAYVAYRVLHDRVGPRRAIREAARAER